ncbi:MAG: hypothetical protein AAF739_07505 [Pseudomonadota bacterium]
MPSPPDDNPITSSFAASLGELEDDLLSLSGALTKDLAKALIQGKELDGLLQSLVLKHADRALDRSLAPVFDLVGSLGESLVGAVTGSLFGGGVGGLGGGTTSTGLASSVVNVSVNATDAASFRSSETQIASSLARAVARGQRGT